MKTLLNAPAFVLLKFYKYGISPVLTFFGVTCRHTPSCSDYAREAIDLHGTWRGGWMTLARLSRCHPLKIFGGTSGIDNVPQKVHNAHSFAPWRYGRWRGTNTDEV